MDYDGEKLTIRKATASDIDGIYAIELVSFRTPWSRNLLLEDLCQLLSYYCVAEYDGTVCGYAGIWKIVDEAHVSNVAVHPDFRGFGIGRRIMLHMMQQAKSTGQCTMTLEVREKNAVARSLYESLGFCANGVRKKYYPDTKEDAIIMWVVL